VPPTRTTAQHQLHLGREALTHGAWEQARASFEAALAQNRSPEAWEGLSWAAWWLDDVSHCLAARERAYRMYRAAGDLRGAARMALWIGDDHLEFLGAATIADNWFQRAERILGFLEPCAEHGWLDAFRAHLALRQDPVEAEALAAQTRELAAKLNDVDLELLALATEGLALVNQGAVADGMQCLELAIAAALSDEFDQVAAAGWACCYMIYACERIRDYDRAAHWCGEVEAFSRRMRIRFVNGMCRAHYAAVLAWHGDWDIAERELVDALDDLTETRPFWRLDAVVRLAALRHRQGRLEEARDLFVEAETHALADIGLAELRLDEGDAAGVRTDLERLLRELPPENPTTRAAPLELLARALAALGEPAAAAEQVHELESIAAAVPTLPLRASAHFAAGVVAAAAGDREGARGQLEDAVELFRQSGAPFEAAQTQLALADVLAALGRTGDAAREATEALRRCEELGAAGQSTRARLLLDRLEGREARRATDPLTPRQVDVLRLMAAGLDYGEIADRLGVGERTVQRHVRNIVDRLGCHSRAAAVEAAETIGIL
jgi:LuxR family transcriptional regulator, maltose regulon positive regulatory protein